MNRFFQVFLSISFLFLVFVESSLAEIKPVSLTCEYLKNPSVVDVPQPRLAWINMAEDNEQGQYQTAWQIRVATSEEKLEQADLWDSKRTLGNQCIRIKYQGKPLKSRQNCWWQVRVWDKNNKASEWSEPAHWHMGLLQTSDWKAKWIGAPWQGEEALPTSSDRKSRLPLEMPPPAPMFRKAFSLNKKIEEAKVYVTGLGYFELYLNGEKVGDDVLVPNQTNYSKRSNLMKGVIPLPDNFREYKVMYLAYDITKELRKGTNVIGGIVGNGFYNTSKAWTEAYGTPRFIAQVHVRYTDGSEEVIVTDKSWKAAKTPILMDMVYYGEHYDARLEQKGWCTSAYDASSWENVALRKAPVGKLVAHTANTDKVVEELKPIRIEKLYNGNYKIDFGIEVSGWVRLKDIQDSAGHKIKIKYLSNQFSGDNSYVFKGEGKENYAARFNWFVFREVEVENWTGILKPEQIVAEVVNTYVEESAEFETSNQLLNKINTIWKRTQTNNMHGGIASDCPHRERSAYTGDGQVACKTVMHNFDTKNFYYKWIHDIIGAQNPETGYVPNGVPWQPSCGGGVAWGAAVCIIPWEFYLHYGAKDILEDSYFSMKEYVRYMKSWVDKDGIMYSQRLDTDGKVLRWFNLGEWVTPGELPRDELVHTFYFWRCANIIAQAAQKLGKQTEAKKYSKLAKQTQKAFYKRFFDEETGSYGVGGSNVFALKMGVPTHQRLRVLDALKKNISENNGNLHTGIFGTRFLFEILSENGLNELAYKIITKEDEPGFGYWIKLGATTTWEQWNTENSHNHPMFGGGLVWFYQNLAGMKLDKNKPAYRHIIFKPELIEDLDFVNYSNNTPYGKAGIKWQKSEGNVSMQVRVPVGCTATVYFPSEEVKENGTSAIKNKQIKVKETKANTTVLEIGSGVYHFHN